MYKKKFSNKLQMPLQTYSKWLQRNIENKLCSPCNMPLIFLTKICEYIKFYLFDKLYRAIALLDKNKNLVDEAKELDFLHVEVYDQMIKCSIKKVQIRKTKNLTSQR
ncbi:hypothetical protein BpHYR1_041968 [Brachionus plicatilis]|uniref:Uncharacterized protein n=1 Tax=Brachionus plicatilis TaxID=10195 RepID=A0A3M7QCT2_BRAPC|nr:hypothetical protein BpHYR1_041968 [Brachionus plicatilis]